MTGPSDRLYGKVIELSTKRVNGLPFANSTVRWAARFSSVLRSLGGTKEESVAIGDGANDLKMMALAGTSVAYHAKPVVRAQASCAITFSGLDAVVNLFD